MKHETQIRLKLIISNAKSLLNNQQYDKNEIIELLYEIINQSTTAIQELRNDR